MYNYSMFLLKVHYFTYSKLGYNIHNKYSKKEGGPNKYIYVLYTFNASVRPSVRPSLRPSVRPSVCLSVCLKPKFGQFFGQSCLNLRWSAERTCNKKTKFGPTFYVFYTFNASEIGRASCRERV